LNLVPVVFICVILGAGLSEPTIVMLAAESKSKIEVARTMDRDKV